MAEEVKKEDIPLKPSEIMKEKAASMLVTQTDLINRLDESPPTEITITFGGLSFILKPDGIKARRLYSKALDMIAKQMSLEGDIYSEQAKTLEKNGS